MAWATQRHLVELGFNQAWVVHTGPAVPSAVANEEPKSVLDRERCLGSCRASSPAWRIDRLATYGGFEVAHRHTTARADECRLGRFGMRQLLRQHPVGLGRRLPAVPDNPSVINRNSIGRGAIAPISAISTSVRLVSNSRCYPKAGEHMGACGSRVVEKLYTLAGTWLQPLCISMIQIAFPCAASFLLVE